MAYFTYPPENGGGSGGVPKYATFADFPTPAVAGNGALAVALDTDLLYMSTGSAWVIVGGPGVALSVGTFDSGTASANGAHIDSNALIMQSASATRPGLVNIGAQTFAGVKTFNAAPNFNSLTASQALVLDASKNVSTLAYATTATANTLALRDNNSNCYANNWVNNTAFIASAGGNTNLTPSSARVEVLTGTLNQSFKLPNANTFPSIGAIFEFNNNSTGILTVNDNSGGLVTNVPSGGYARVILLDNSTAAGTWDFHFLVPSDASFGTAGLNVTGTIVASSTVQGTRLISTVATGTAPLVVASTTQVANLNAATAGNFTGSLLGDVTGTQSATVLSATTNATLTTLSALTTASSLASIGTVTSGTWSATTIAINKGGTGQTTAAAAFAALSPMTTAGDIIYEAAGPAPARLGIGSTGNVLTVSGGLPVWAPPATSGTVTSVAMSVPSFLSVTGSPVTSSGTLAVSYSGTALPVANGGTGLTSGTSGGVLGFTASGTIASSAALTASQLVIGGGAGATVSTLAAGTANQYLKMNSTPIPAWFTIGSPTIQKFTSGSGTYTTPANVVWIHILMIGGGGGGSGGGASTPTNGGAGGNTTFGSSLLTANGGPGGVWNSGPSTGGTTTINSPAVGTGITGGSTAPGMSGVAANAVGGNGASSPLGGAGRGAYSSGATATAGAANSGSGGGGGGSQVAASTAMGAGGAAGGYISAIITAPSATYSYAIGAAGTAGGVGTGGGFAGAAGGSGYIIVTEFYV